MANEVTNYNNSGRMWAGLFVFGIGMVLLADRLGMALPRWVFSWPMLLITIGAFLGLSHRFRGGAWLILMVIGSIFLFDMVAPTYSLKRYFWPIMVMVLGLILIFKPKRSGRWQRREEWRNYRNDYYAPAPAPSSFTEAQSTPFESSKTTHTDTSDYLDSSAVFGGIRKAFFTKDFKGGEAVSIFGGHEIDLSKSDIQGTVTLELTQIFGGTKLIVPKNWNIKSEIVALLGGMEDKRHTDTISVDPQKVLLLKGTSILGGIDIRSY